MKLTLLIGSATVVQLSAGVAAAGLRHRSQGTPLAIEDAFSAVLHRKGASASATEEDLIQLLTRNPGQLGNMSGIVKDTLLPAIDLAHKAAEAALHSMEHSSKESFKLCVPPVGGTGSADLSQQKILHEECRGSELELGQDFEACDLIWQTLNKNTGMACGAFSNLTRDPHDAKAQCGPVAGQTWRDWLKANRDWFDDQVNKYDAADEACMLANNASSSKGGECQKKSSSLRNKRSECNVKQAALEDGYCAQDEEAVNGCSSYEACFANKNATYQAAKVNMTTAMESRKVNWGMLKRIGCLLEVLASGGDETAADACKDKVWNTDHLDLFFNPLPLKVPCSGAGGSPVPCSNDYINQVYGALPMGVQPATCQPCFNASTASAVQYKQWDPVGSPNGAEVCIGGGVFVYTKDWDCDGFKLHGMPVPKVGATGWEAAVDHCAKDCLGRDDCSSFHYPDPGDGWCVSIQTSRNDVARGWSCGAMAPDWVFFTRVPGLTC